VFVDATLLWRRGPFSLFFPQILGCSKLSANRLHGGNFFVHNAKFEMKFFTLWKFCNTVKILSCYNFLCRKIATLYPAYFLTHDAAAAFFQFIQRQR